MKKSKGTNLTFIPINDPLLIPEYLVEQMKDREFEVEKFYQVMPLMMKNPFLIFGAFANRNDEVKGFLLGAVSPLDKWLYVNMLSIDKEYQGKGIIKESLGILKKVVKAHELNGIHMSSTRPMAFEKEGFIRSKSIKMRYIYG